MVLSVLNNDETLADLNAFSFRGSLLSLSFFTTFLELSSKASNNAK